jgi:hypothetical protein
MLCIIFPVNVIILSRRKKNLNKRIKEKKRFPNYFKYIIRDGRRRLPPA